MNTSSRFVVATHIMVGLAGMRIVNYRDTALTSEFISDSVNTNPVVIRRILGMLRRAGLVTSQTGPDGGSRLALPAEEINLLDIYNAVEEGHLFHSHYNEPNMDCPFGHNIQDALGSVLTGAEEAMKNSLAKQNLLAITKDVLERSGIRALLDQGFTSTQIREQFEYRDGKFVKKSKVA